VCEEALVVEALRRDVEQLQRTVSQALGDGARLSCIEARVQSRCGGAVPIHEVDLVLHQRDERRDDDGHAVEHERGQLVAEALAAAGGENGERRAAVEQRVDDLTLAWTERGEPEAFAEGLEGVHRRDATGRAARRYRPNGRFYVAGVMGVSLPERCFQNAATPRTLTTASAIALLFGRFASMSIDGTAFLALPLRRVLAPIHAR